MSLKPLLVVSLCAILVCTGMTGAVTAETTHIDSSVEDHVAMTTVSPEGESLLSVEDDDTDDAGDSDDTESTEDEGGDESDSSAEDGSSGEETEEDGEAAEDSNNADELNDGDTTQEESSDTLVEDDDDARDENDDDTEDASDDADDEDGDDVEDENDNEDTEDSDDADDENDDDAEDGDDDDAEDGDDADDENDDDDLKDSDEVNDATDDDARKNDDGKTGVQTANASAVSEPSSGGGGSGQDTSTGPSPAGVGLVTGAGAVAAGLLARRLALSGTTGSVSMAANAGSATMLTGARGATQVAVSLASELADRVRMIVTDWGERIIGAGGYAKWAGDDPLAHETRAELHDQIQAEPGTCLSALGESQTLDVSFGTVRYHLRILEREGLVTSEKVNGRRQFYPVGTSPDTLNIALNRDPTRKILEALAESADTVSGLASRVDRDPSTVSHHLSRLEDDGIVERERDGQAVTNRLTSSVKQVLSQEAFTDSRGIEIPADD